MLDLGRLTAKYDAVELDTVSPYGEHGFRAQHRDLGRYVTIRRQPRVASGHSGQQEELFRRAARTASGIHHHNLLQVLDYESTPTGNLLVSEYVEGETLQAALDRDGPMSLERAFEVTWQLTAALEAAHAAGCIHRNLKPSEIVVTPSGVVKLGGFEAAALLDADDPTARGEGLGNVFYLAPEQLSGEEPTEQSDVYALGVLVYRMLTGHLPFDGMRNAWAIFRRKLVADPEPPSHWRGDLPEAVDEWVARTLHRSPGSRFESVREVREALRVLSSPPPEPESAANLITLRYPSPIALPYVRLANEIDPMYRFSRLLDTFEATLKYGAVIALVNVLEATGGIEPDRLAKLYRPALGDWERFLDYAVQAPAGHSETLHERLHRFYRGDARGRDRSLETVGKATSYRNKLRGHGATLTPGEYQRGYDELLPAVDAILQALDFVTEYTLGYVVDLNFDSGTFEITYGRCMGAVPATPTETTRSSTPVGKGTLIVVDRDGERLLDLTPLLHRAVCPTCGDDEIFYFNGSPSKRKADYLNYHKGHTFRASFDEDPLRKRGFVA